MRAVLAVVVAVGSVAANAEPVTIEGKAVEVQVTRPGQGTLTADADVTIEGASMPLKGQSAVEWNPTSGGLRSATLRGPTKWTAGGKLYDLAPGPINFEDRGRRWVSQATLAAPFQLTVDGVSFTAAPGQVRFDQERLRSFMSTPATLTIGGYRVGLSNDTEVNLSFDQLSSIVHTRSSTTTIEFLGQPRRVQTISFSSQKLRQVQLWEGIDFSINGTIARFQSFNCDANGVIETVALMGPVNATIDGQPTALKQWTNVFVSSDLKQASLKKITKNDCSGASASTDRATSSSTAWKPPSR
jgi:hypothetical protein